MSWIRFLLKFVFICNLCFITSEILRMTILDPSINTIVNYIVVLGVGVAFPLNGLVCILTGILLLLKKITWKGLPPWLYLFNIIIFVFQLIVNF